MQGLRLCRHEYADCCNARMPSGRRLLLGVWATSTEDAGLARMGSREKVSPASLTSWSKTKGERSTTNYSTSVLLCAPKQHLQHPKTLQSGHFSAETTQYVFCQPPRFPLLYLSQTQLCMHVGGPGSKNHEFYLMSDACKINTMRSIH